MQQSLEFLLEGVIDYAGLFPPAKLPVAEAYAEYLSVHDHWIVNRFVCSTADLIHLRREIELNKPSVPLEIVAIGKASTDDATWEDALEHDAVAMTSFNEKLEGLASIEAYEIRIPSHENLVKCVRDLRGFEEAEVFVELPPTEDISQAVAALVDSDWLYAKFRTGPAKPSAESVAAFMHEAISFDLPLKLTAGLHHPFTTPEHFGFLNVLIAACLIYAEDLPRSQAARLLAEEDPKAFSFNTQELSWRGVSANIEAIRETRDLFVGFGSCSVSEPLDEMESLGLMG
ncbi:hypothetical protein BH11ARM1_BH11ARM1_02300 [soil metagenome]